MTGQSAHKTAKQRKPKARNFYIINYSDGRKAGDFEVENFEALSPDRRALRPPEGRRGFPDYPEKPRVVIGKPPPSDIELYHSYWLISDRLKSVFEAVDPPAFAFQACDVKFRDGSPGPVYWLCDVVRVLEALGEPTLQDIRRKYGGFLAVTKNLVFNESVIGNSHIFRTPYRSNTVICDQAMKDSCKEAGIRGIAFHNCR